MFRLTVAGLLLGLGATAASAQQQPAPLRYSLRNPTPRAQLRKLHPDRPGITQSAFTLDPGHFQIETNLLRLRNGREDGLRHRELLLNHAVLKLGLSERTDVQVKLESYSIEKEWPTGQAEPERHRGFGDVSVRLKRNLIGDDENRPAGLAISGYVSVPTGGALGRGGLEAGLSLPFEYRLAESTGLSVQLQGDLEHDRDARRHYLALQPAATINHDFNSVLGSYAELMSHWDSRNGRWRNLLNIGPELTLSENVQLDMGAGLPLNSRTDREFFLGFTYRR
ncbi:transporter [Hymenobacter sp. B81]|uniref:transporter n=1 Tax=Hymenobacter sp. B81 TaxID=3344878 RepID=UPI0037DCA8C6